MKYGSELSQRSVPEWKSHNLDYDEIKTLIKRATTDNTKDPTSETHVLEALKSEFEHISLFVRSKTGEIDRRIIHCQKTIDHIAEDDRVKEESYAAQGKSYAHHLNSKRRQTRLYKLRTEINRVTVEVQNLARFIGVQRTGFRKLLKKYAKWSGKQTLHQSFLPILEGVYSFTQQDFTPVFLELSFIFETLRQAKYQSINTYIGNALGERDGSDPAQFDTEMVTLATNMPNAGAVAMWVHPDHITELKVMLLKTMSFVDSPKTLRQKGEVLATSVDTAQGPGTPTLSRRPSLTLTRALSDSHVTEYSHAVYLDDPRKLISIQTNTEPGQIRWVDVLPSDGQAGDGDADSPHQTMHLSEASPEIDPDYVLCAPVGGFRHFAASRISRDLADAIYHSNLEDVKWEIDNLNGSGKLAVEWVAKRNAVPLSQASMHRSRFLFEDSLSMSIGERRKSVSIFEQGTPSGSALDNPNESSKVWATLDEEISVKRAGFHSHFSKDGPKSALFPYAVLEVKWKGLKPQWIEDIEKSHLVHVVEGFSVYSHSIALFHAQALSKPPHWMKTLNKVDLLKLPPKKVREETPDSTGNSAQLQLSRDTPSQLQSGSILLNSSPGSIPSLTDELSDTSQETTEPPKVRYWNEFDNPEDGEDDSGIFIYTNGDEQNLTHDFLSEGHVNKLIRISDNLADKVQKTASKVRELMGIKPKATSLSDEESASDNEEESLLRGRLYSPRLNPNNYNDYDYGSAASSVSEQVTDIYGEDEFAGYGHQQQLVADRRDRVLSLFYSTCFLLSTLIVGVLCGIIAGEDMNQVSGGAIAFSFLAFMFSTALGIVGLTLYLMRTSTPSLWHQSFVFVVMMLNVCFGVGGFAWLLAEIV
ncbi:hypothetical protein CJU90_3009 [Yarrowia sp. C11]|nr:hypothetical protein CKK34_4459 [Yarrowia sp. E02]KAG5369550.1 hypothetical protein CJU90_3009 [Yarrowia sp. C11]